MRLIAISVSVMIQKWDRPATASRHYGPFSLLLILPSIQERHISHRLRLALGVHQDPMPAMKRDRGMVGVTNAALDVNARIPLHRPPTPALCLRIARQDHFVLRVGDAVRVPRADVDRFAARSIAELGPMRLAAISTGQ